ncbi:MAG: hypothetical protein LBN07_05100 [Christensenellaceae bacterium]|nr:hypothetical protein [Christensenellaceae bacterium]
MKFAKEYEMFIKAKGQDSQMIHCIEEMSELTKEICKYMRVVQFDSANTEKLEKVKQNIIEETADCLNFLEQMQLIFGAEEVDKLRQQKIERTIKKLQGK